uniref:Putative translational coupling peptide n=1 Tax=Rhodothermus marinus TaxID=29549 RepID=Q52875_RHOMR|nr:putative translational coupling peptide [Rhodothermus marinus]
MVSWTVANVLARVVCWGNRSQPSADHATDTSP